MAQRPPYDKAELSPNSLATCKYCMQKIQKGEERVGIQEFFSAYHKWGPYYYHRTCCTPQVLSNLHLPPTRTPVNRERDDPNPIAPEERARLQRRLVLFEERRVLLRQKLRRLRSSFARQLDVPPYIIFHDTTLDSIVENMPTTRQGLLACYGIGPKKLSDFGEEILDVIAQHRADPDR